MQEIVGKTKAEKIITDKSEYDVGMVILAVGFRPNTALAQDKIRLFPNGAFLVDKYQETSMPDIYSMLSVIVLRFITMRYNQQITSPLLQMLSVQELLQHTTLVVIN